MEHRTSVIISALSRAAAGTAFTPVQVQKIFFLIDKEAAALVEGPLFDFQPYDYGPFDKNVYREIDLCRLAGWIETENYNRYQAYKLTVEGIAEGEKQFKQLNAKAQEYITKVVQWVRGLTFEQLVGAIYNKYPEMKVNSVFRQ